MRSFLGVVVAAILVTVAGSSSAQPAASLSGESPFAGIVKSWQEAYNRKDAAAVASLYTEDAIMVVPNGVLHGREAIQRNLEAGLNADTHDLSVNTVASHVDGNTGWIITEWKAQIRSQDGTVRPTNGFTNAIFAQSGNNWKIRVHTNVPAPPPKQ